MLANLGALLGGPMAGLLSDRLGRKMTLLLGGLPSMVGWLLVAYSYIPLVDIGGTFDQFYSLLLIGRFFTGVSMGWYSLIVPVSSTILCTCVHLRLSTYSSNIVQ